MAVRRYGPTRGAGVAIIEKDAEKTISTSALGVTVQVGVYKRGEVGELNYNPKKKQFLKKMGGRLENGYLAPDAAIDFYDLSEGAGELWNVRVTDGTEVKSWLYLKSRRIPRTNVIKVEAKNGGRWGGKRSALCGVWATTATDLSETVLKTGKTMLKNYWAGGTLQLAEVTTKTYEIVSNTVDGDVTVVSDSTMETDYGAGSSKEYSLTLANGTERLAVEIMDGADKPTEEWGLKAYVDGELVLDKPNLSSNPNSGRYFVNDINNDTGNDEIKVTDLWTGGWAADIRPANHNENLVTLSETAAKVEIMQATVNSPGGGDATVGGFTYGQDVKKQVLTLTFSDATNYTVVSDVFGALGAGVVGSLFTPDFGADVINWIPKFVVTAGATAMAATDTIVIVANPLVTDELIGGKIYPNKVTKRREFFVVSDNTVDTVTVKASDDMTTNATAGTAATVTGTGTGPFDTSSDNEFKVAVNGGIETTITLTSGATTPAATIVDDINAIFPGLATAVSDQIKLTSLIGGRFSKIATGAGNANAELGFTDNITYSGAAGDEAMLVWPQQMEGGYDGVADLADADFEAMYDVDTSPINQLFGKNKGLVKLATPGVTSTAVQKKGAAYAEAKNYQYRYEIPSNIVTEDAAEEYVNDTLGRNDFAVCAFPSYGYMSNPIANSTGLKLISLTGAIQGREAKVAKNYNGFHKAAAGEDVILNHVLKLPTGEKILDEELLNPQGIQIIKFAQGNCIIWGDRTLSIDPGWRWKHQRELMSHYENTLRENFGWIIFAINDPSTWELAWISLYEYFLNEHSKRALRGDSPGDAFSIKIDAENNTAATIAAGDVNADIRLRLADTVERFNITMSKLGIFESIN